MTPIHLLFSRTTSTIQSLADSICTSVLLFIRDRMQLYSTSPTDTLFPSLPPPHATLSRDHVRVSKLMGAFCVLAGLYAAASLELGGCAWKGPGGVGGGAVGQGMRVQLIRGNLKLDEADGGKGID